MQKTIRLDSGFARICVLEEKTLRLQISRDGKFPENGPERYGIYHLTPLPCPALCEEREEGTVFSTSSFTFLLRQDGSFRLTGPEGNVLTETDVPVKLPEKGYSVRLTSPENERFYGLGDICRDTVQRRGISGEIWVRNVKSYVPAPFLLGSRGWGLFCNTTFRHHFDVCRKDPHVLEIRSSHGFPDLVFFTGDSFPSLLQKYAGITGKPRLLPIQAYGLTFVCNMQNNARDTLDDALRFRQESIPCDIIGLEPGWMQEYYDATVNKEFHKERFFLPSWSLQGKNLANTFFGALNRMGFLPSLWLCCDYDLSHEEERKASFRDRANAETAGSLSPDDFEQDQNIGHEPLKMDKITVPGEPWFRHLEKFVDYGVRAFKMDGAWQVNDHPDRKWANGMDDEEMHNLYPLLLNRQMAEGFEAHTGKRAMIYSSGGYAGIQQYAATWAGDTGGEEKPLVSMLNHAMSGHTNTSCDMHVFTPAGIHFGFLQPWSQVCSWAYWRHPWFLDESGKAMFRDYARLRYSLIPYIYSSAHEAYRLGIPILRPLCFDDPEDLRSENLLHQYLFGKYFLVTVFRNQVYLPKGTWTDYFTGRVYEGGSEMDYVVPEGKGGGLFVKEGAILPLWNALDFIRDPSPREMTIELFPGKQESVFDLYEDDGTTLDYQKGFCNRITITCRKQDGFVLVKITAAECGWREKISKMLTLRIHGEPARVKVNGILVPCTQHHGFMLAENVVFET